jgi:hypothetical protein
MRFIVMHKTDATMEAGDPPDHSIIQAMGQLIQGSIESGVFQNGAGLHRSAQRARLSFKGGKRTVTRGPFTGDNALVASFYMLRTRSMDTAIELAGRFAAIFGDVELEIGPVVEPWDLGLIPKPETIESSRFLLLRKGDAHTERGAELEPARAKELAELVKRLTDEGVLLLTERIAPSARGSRLASGPKGKRTWVDGPFAESKEMIAGFSLITVPTKADALEWADRYAAILLGNEVDVRELLDERDSRSS